MIPFGLSWWMDSVTIADEGPKCLACSCFACVLCFCHVIDMLRAVDSGRNVVLANFARIRGCASGSVGMICMVDDAGDRYEGDRFSVGSGSTYAYGVLDTGYVF